MRTHLDIFSGIGGFALAAQWNGLETIGFAETDPYASAVLRKHWPDVPNYGDVRTMPVIHTDLLTAGVPCQPASCAGKRKGAADDRWLWPAALRILREAKPCWALFENPTGLLSLKSGLEFEHLLSEMEIAGYEVWSLIIPACSVDAPHRRNRIWIVAHAKGERIKRERGNVLAAAGQGNPDESESHASCALADATGPRRSAEGQYRSGPPPLPSRLGERGALANGEGARCGKPSAYAAAPPIERRTGASRPAAWLPEPGVGRVVDGFPGRAHRIKRLGNAIVPQAAGEIIRCMIEAERYAEPATS